MLAKQTFAVLALGMPERELRILKTTCRISQARARAYVLATDPPQGAPDLVIVDGESDAALATRARAGWSALPTLFVARGDANDARSLTVLRPLVPTRILTALDDLTRRFGKSVPELLRRPPGPG
jgi:hypothetical protein